MLRAPVLRGLLRAKLLLGCDPRLLVLAGLVILLGIFAWPLFIVGGFIFMGARLVGAISPYFIDEKIVYMRWRFVAWNGMLRDEAFAARPDRGTLRVTRKVEV